MPESQTVPITPDSISSDQLVSLWGTTKVRFEQSRRRIVYAREVAQGMHGWTRPDIQTDDDAINDPLTQRLPQRWMLTTEAINRLSANKPVIKRAAIGATPTARKGAELLALAIDTAVNEALDVEEAFGKAVDDGEWACLAVPSDAHFRRIPDFMDTLDEGAYAKLPDAEQKTYSRNKKDNVYERPKERYWRDAKGVAPDEAGYGGRRSAKATRKAWEEEKQAYLKSVMPWVVRLVSATDCVPILVSGRGKQRFECRGLVIRTLYTREDLLEQRFVWPGMHQRELIPLGFDPNNTYGANGSLYLYEAHLMVWCERCKQMDWIVAYSVAGLETESRAKAKDGNDKADAVFNLSHEWGIHRGLFGYYYGLHSSSDNPDQRGIPYAWPLAKLIVGAESLLTATQVFAATQAFHGYFAQLSPEAPRESYIQANGELRKFSMPGVGEIVFTPGPVTPAVPAQIGDAAKYALERELGLLLAETPDVKAEGIDSGHGLNVAADLARAATRQIPEGVRQCYQDVGEWLLEIACAVKRVKNVAVPIEINEEVEPGADVAGEGESHYRTIEIQDRWVAGVYKLNAVYPNRGNEAQIQLEMTLQQQGLSTRKRVLEMKGVDQPEAELARIDAEQILIGTPEGKLAQLANALRVRGEQQKADALDMQLSQRLSQFGMPTAALGTSAPSAPPGGLPEQGAPGGAAPLPNLAASQLGGVVAGQREIGPQMQDMAASAAISPNGGA